MDDHISGGTTGATTHMTTPVDVGWDTIVDSLTPPQNSGQLGEELKARIAAGEVIRVTMHDHSTKEFWDAQEFGDWYAVLQAGP